MTGYSKRAVVGLMIGFLIAAGWSLPARAASDCPEGQTQFKIDDRPSNGSYSDGTLRVQISDAQEDSFSWSSNIAVDSVVVKGGSDTKTNPGGTSGTATSPDNPNNDQRYGISHVSFCYTAPDDQGDDDQEDDDGRDNDGNEDADGRDDNDRDDNDQDGNDQDGNDQEGKKEGEVCSSNSDRPGHKVPSDQDADEFCNRDEEGANDGNGEDGRSEAPGKQDEVCGANTDRPGDKVPPGQDMNEFCNDEDSAEVSGASVENPGNVEGDQQGPDDQTEDEAVVAARGTQAQIPGVGNIDDSGAASRPGTAPTAPRVQGRRLQAPGEALPFTGVQPALYLLIAVGLISGGLFLRRARGN